MKFFALSFLPCLALAQLHGVYQLPSNQAGCASALDLVLKSDNTLVKRHCVQDNAKKITFGVYFQNNDKIDEFYSTGGSKTVSVKSSVNSINYDGVNLEKKTDDSEFAKVASIFGTFEAAPGNEANCAIASKLEIFNSGRIVKTYCQNNQSFYTRGFFEIISFADSKVVIDVKYNGTEVKSTLNVIDANSFEFEGKVLLKRIN
ncbi:hypothetical protein K502DRAFT_338880 [Neoconidiobolus thromboides FSU 785]|nr:hypothetical protein K502DRAFT_338880 [Neoconidiobolus thromboides FSU 785]